MFGFSFWEIAIVLGIALVVFGPKKLPELARSLGKGLREFRKATDDFRSTIDSELHAPDPKPVAAQAEPQNFADPGPVARETGTRGSAQAVTPNKEEDAVIEPEGSAEAEALAKAATAQAEAAAAQDHGGSKPETAPQES